MKNYIANAFDYEYYNRIVEEIENVIKKVKRYVNRYRKSTHFKAKIILIKKDY